MASAQSAVFAVEHVAHGAAAQSVALGLDSAVHAAIGEVDAGTSGFGFGGLRFAARGAAIGKAGLAGQELKFIPANDTGFDRKCHATMVAKNGCGNREGATALAELAGLRTVRLQVSGESY